MGAVGHGHLDASCQLTPPELFVESFLHQRQRELEERVEVDAQRIGYGRNYVLVQNRLNQSVLWHHLGRNPRRQTQSLSLQILDRRYT